MHEALIGQEASLSMPCTVDAASLLLGFIEELMEVSGSEADDSDGLAAKLREAVGKFCRHDAGAPACQLEATLEIHDDRVDVTLTCETHAADVQHLVVAREA